MECDKCKCQVGLRYRLSPEWSGCLHCNGDMQSIFPRWTAYLGLTPDGLHEFRYDDPAICPACGAKSTGILMPCEQDGGYYEVPTHQQSETPLQLVQEQQLLSLLPFQPPLPSQQGARKNRK